MVGCCKLSLYANESCDEHAIFFLAMIEMTCHVNHFFDLECRLECRCKRVLVLHILLSLIH